MIAGALGSGARKEETMGTIGKVAISLAVLAAIGALVMYESPRLVKA